MFCGWAINTNGNCKLYDGNDHIFESHSLITIVLKTNRTWRGLGNNNDDVVVIVVVVDCNKQDIAHCIRSAMPISAPQQWPIPATSSTNQRAGLVDIAGKLIKTIYCDDDEGSL